MLGHGKAARDEIDRRVALRVGRQKILDRESGPRLWAVIDEAALRRPIGGADVMREQIDALIAAAERPNVQIQLLPFEVGGHAAAGGAYSILRFADRELPDVVFIEQLTGALYLDKREDVDHYAATMERLCVEAASAEDTVRRLAELKRSAYPEG
jgi:hypothetical protein